MKTNWLRKLQDFLFGSPRRPAKWRDRRFLVETLEDRVTPTIATLPGTDDPINHVVVNDMVVLKSYDISVPAAPKILYSITVDGVTQDKTLPLLLTDTSLSVELGAGDDTLTIGPDWDYKFAVTFKNLAADAGTDTLEASATASTFTLTANGAGRLSTAGVGLLPVTFLDVESLKGGVGKDTFTLGTFGVEGSIDGAGEADTLSAATLDAGTVSHVESLTVATKLTGSGTFKWNGTVWSINDVPAGTPALIQGGSGKDIFDINATLALGTKSVKGGGGDDVFNVASGVNVTATTGQIDGEGDSDTLTFADSRNVFLKAATANGYTLDTVAGGDAFTGLDAVTAVGGTLTGAAADATWSVAAAGSTYAVNTSPNPPAPAPSLSFSGFDTLQGGTLADTVAVNGAFDGAIFGGTGNDDFTVAHGGSVTGKIDGQAGTNSLTYADLVSVLLTAAPSAPSGQTPNGYSGTDGGSTGGFIGIDTLSAAAAGSTLTGLSAPSAWSVTTDVTTTTYHPTSITTASLFLHFAGFDKVVGGDKADAFTLGVATTLVSIDGGGVSAGADTVTADVYDATAGKANGSTLTRISSISATGKLVGSGKFVWDGTQWTLTSTAAPDVAIAFGTPVTVQGEGGADEFDINDDLTATDKTKFVNGGGGADRFYIAAGKSVKPVANSGPRLDGQDGADELHFASGSYVHVRQATAGGDGYTLYTTDSNNQNVSADFANINAVFGEAAGGDVLIGAARTVSSVDLVNTWTLTASATTTTYNDGSAERFLRFGGFETLQGGSKADVFQVTGAYTDSGAINGGDGADSFQFAPGGSLTATINGQGGTDTLDYSGYDAAVAIDLEAGTATGLLGTGARFSHIGNLIGSPVTQVNPDTGATYDPDTLTAPNGTNVWTSGAPGEGSIVSTGGTHAGTYTFSSFGNAVGGTQTDRFVLTGHRIDATHFVGAAFNSVDGGGGADFVDYTGYTGDPLDVNLATNVATALGAISRLENFKADQNQPKKFTPPTSTDPKNPVKLNTHVDSDGKTITDTVTQTTGTEPTTYTFVDVAAPGSTTPPDTGTKWNRKPGDGAYAFVVLPGEYLYDAEGLGGDDTIDFSQYDRPIRVNLQDGTVYFNDGTGDVLSGTFLNVAYFLGTSVVGNTDTFIGLNADAEWDLANPTVSGSAVTAAYTSGTDVKLGFGGFEAVKGGTGKDTFTLRKDASITSIDAGDGADSLTQQSEAGDTVLWDVTGAGAGSVGAVSFAGVESVAGSLGADKFTLRAASTLTSADGGDGDDSFTLEAGAAVTSLAGGNGADTLTRQSAAADAVAWSVTGAGAGSVGGTTFTSIGTLVGGDGQDTFTLKQGAAVASLSGGGGDDRLTVEANDDATWSITGANAGALGTLPFDSIESLVGGGGADAFTVSAGASIKAIAGSGGDDTVSVAAGATVGSIDGGEGADSFTLAAGAAVGSIDGGAGANTLTVQSAAADAVAWSVTGAGAGTVGGTSFTSVGALVGGDGRDSFTLGQAAVVASLAGGGGDDQFTLAAGASVGTIDGGNGTDTLTRQSAAGDAVAWTVTGPAAGTVGGTSFTSIGTLVGGDGQDAFTLKKGANVESISGGGGSDSLAIESDGATGVRGTAGYVPPQTVTWTITRANGGKANGLPFDSIENLVGGNGTDLFTASRAAYVTSATGAGGDNTFTQESNDGDAVAWAVTGAGAGTVGGTRFASIGSLVGGDGKDTFTLQSEAGVQSIDGGRGADTVVGPDAKSVWESVALHAGRRVVDGNPTPLLTFHDVEALVGGNQEDVFRLLGSDGSFVDTIDGGGGADTLVGPDAKTIWEVDDKDHGARVVDADPATHTPKTTLLTFDRVETLVGGKLDDVFRLVGNGYLTGKIDGGGYSAGSKIGNSLVLVGSPAGTVFDLTPGVAKLNGHSTKYTNIQFVSVQGGVGNDQFIVHFDGPLGDPLPAFGLQVNGGAGTDTLTVYGAPTATQFRLNAVGLGVALDLKAIDYRTIIAQQVEKLDLIGGKGIDQFTVLGTKTPFASVRYTSGGGADQVNLSPSTTTQYIVRGGALPAQPYLGVGLYVNLAGAALSTAPLSGNRGHDGLYRFRAFKPIYFSNISRGLGGRVDIRPVQPYIVPLPF